MTLFPVETPFPRGKVVVCQYDLDFNLTYVNPAFARMLGYTREALIGQNLKLIAHPSIPPALLADIRQTTTQGRPFADYDALWQWSVDEPEAFWTSIWQLGQVIGTPGAVVAQGLDTMPGTRWFPEARLNFAENLLRQRGPGMRQVGERVLHAANFLIVFMPLAGNQHHVAGAGLRQRAGNGRVTARPGETRDLQADFHSGSSSATPRPRATKSGSRFQTSFMTMSRLAVSVTRLAAGS